MEAQRKALQRGEAPRMEGVQHSSLTTDVLEDCVGPRWDEKRHVRLDFSSPLFCLETLTGRDGGLLNPRLNLSNLLTLDISNNALTDIDSVLSVHNGFKRLHTLKASRNRITQADLDLPTLAYLDLSFNQLKRLPRFEGIRNTEELLLSNNHISDSDLESFVLLGNLRVLDLSYNRISTLPSNFVEDLAYLKGLTKLTKVDFRGNQCSAWFPEYAAVLVGNAVARGQHLQQLDGEAIAPRSEKEITEMAAQVIANLEQYDSIYIERQEAEATRPRLAKYAIKTALAGDDGDVTIGRLSEILERVLTISSDASAELGATFYDICFRVHAMEEEERISTFWRQLPASDKARRNAAKELVQKAQLALEVCEEARPLILRGLASLCLVSEGSLGHKLAAVLSRMAQQEFAAQSEGDVGGIAAQVLAEIVVPSILEAADQERVVMDVLTGLTEGTECLSLAVALSSCVSLLADLLTVSGPTPHLCRVLCVICLSQENCVEATGQGIPQLLCRRVLDEGVPEDDQGLMLFCDMCIIMGRCAWHNRKASLHLTRAAIHTSIFLPKLRDLIGEREATSRLPIPQAKVAGAIIGALTGMIRSCDEAMDICCDNYHLIDLLLPALKEEAADPVILAASCTGVRVILENPRQRAELLQYVTEEMRGFEGLLQYLGGTRYTAMCDRAELALRNINQLPYVPERVPLNRLTNIYACRVLASICNFLAFYLAEETDQMVQGIAEELFAAHREKAIVDVLEVKNEEVLVAAVECLNSIPLRYITKETVALLLKLVNRLPFPHAGLSSSVLQSVVKLLTRLALWESPQVHAVLWGMHAAETVNAVFDVIYRNLSTLRTPARKAVIENMHALNRVSVHFLLAASRVSSVRDTMRLKGVVSLFGPVLEAEQQVDVHPDGFDVVVERTWTGRDVNVLLTSLSGTHKLNPKKKEAFRVVCRLADIIQGWPDTPDAAKDLSLRALCSREGEMWDDDAALRRHLEMDDREESERAPQQTDFVRLCIAERLSLLLTPLCSHSTTQRYARQRAMKQHAEYWAGRLKADIEDAEEEIAKAEEEAAAEEEEETAVLQQPQQRSDLLRAIAQSKPRSWRERVQNRSRPHHQQTTNAQAKKKKKQKDSLEELQDDPVYADLYGKPEEGKTGRERLMQKLMAANLDPEPDLAAMYLNNTVDLYGEDGLWANFHAAELQPCYIIAAALRLLYAAIEYPQTAVAREETVKVCRGLLFLRSLTALVETAPFLAANVGAKFCRLMQRVLRLEPHQPVESMDLILNYDIVAECTRRMMSPLHHLIRQASTRPLDLREQILCGELAALYASIARQIPYIKFSVERDVQDWAVEKTYERVFPSSTIRVFVSMLLMDLAIDSGSSHGSYVSHLMSRLALQRERMRVDCIDILSALMQHCPEELSFEAIEALQHARIFLHYPIRPSVMYELLDLTNTQYFKRTLELLLSEHAQTAERVLQIAPVLWYNALKHEDSAPVRVMAVATSRRFYIVERPTGIREPLFPEREYVYNKGEGIRLIEIREYRHLTRIVKGYPADNWLAAGWLHKENEGPNGETFDCLLMEVLSQTTDFIVCLRALSGETEEERVDVLRDVVSAECLLQHIKLQIIQDSFLAIRRTTPKDGAPIDRLGLYILTSMYLHEFFIDWKYWFAFDPTSAEEQWGVQLQCLQGETDELNWRLPQGGLTNFLGWVEEEEEEEEKEKETQENADKDNIKDFVKDKEEYTLKGIRLDAINQGGPAWLSNLFGRQRGRTQRRLSAAKENLFKPNEKHKLQDIRQVAFSGGEACWVEITCRQPRETREDKRDNKENKQKKDNKQNKQTAPIINLLLLDDSSRERFRRNLAQGLNKTEESMSWRRIWRSTNAN